MFIITEDTPNPETMKFIPGCPVLGSKQPIDFASKAQAKGVSDFVAKIFDIEGVERVFLGSDFITVTKKDRDWKYMRAAILEVIMDQFVLELPILDGEIKKQAIEHKPEDAEIVAQIEDLIETRIRPTVAGDGGDITVERYEDGVVYVVLKGACSGCPSSTATLKGGIENLLKHYIPEVQEVRSVF